MNEDKSKPCESVLAIVVNAAESYVDIIDYMDNVAQTRSTG